MSNTAGRPHLNRIYQFQPDAGNPELSEESGDHEAKTGIERAIHEAWETSRLLLVQKYTNIESTSDTLGTNGSGGSNCEDNAASDRPHENSNTKKNPLSPAQGPWKEAEMPLILNEKDNGPQWLMPDGDNRQILNWPEILDKFVLGTAYSLSIYGGWRLVRSTLNSLRSARTESAMLNHKPTPSQITAAQERTRQQTIRVATTRTLDNYDRKDVQLESLKLLDRVRDQNDNANREGKGLTAHIDAVRAFGLLAMPEISNAANVTARTLLLNDVLKELQTLTNLGNDPVLRKAVVLSDDSLTCGGRIQFQYRGQSIEPVFCEGERLFFRDASGQLEAAPVKDCTVHLRVAKKTLEEAGPDGQLQASELVSTLFHQIEQISRLSGRLERAQQQDVDLKSDDPTTFYRQESFLKREKEKSDVSADYLQFVLNGKSIDGKTFGDCVTFDIDNVANLTHMKGEHLVAFTDSRGRIQMYIVNPVGPPTKLDEKLSKSMIEKGLQRLVDDCDMRIKREEQKSERNENLLAELKKDRQRNLDDLRSYRTSPRFQSSLHSRISRCSEILRSHSGKAVSIIILTTMLLEHARQANTDIDFSLDVPIK